MCVAFNTSDDDGWYFFLNLSTGTNHKTSTVHLLLDTSNPHVPQCVIVGHIFADVDRE